MERPRALHLEQRGWEIIPLGHAKRLGQLNIIHREILAGMGNQGGAFPARKAVELFSGMYLLVTHTRRRATQRSRRLKNVRSTWDGINPILGACNPDYLRNRPAAWLNGFTVVELHANGCSPTFGTYCTSTLKTFERGLLHILSSLNGMSAMRSQRGVNRCSRIFCRQPFCFPHISWRTIAR
jgi:hypothetical protein